MARSLVEKAKEAAEAVLFGVARLTKQGRFRRNRLGRVPRGCGAAAPRFSEAVF